MSVNERLTKRRCNAVNRRGERCRSTTGIGATGYCSAHDPEGSFDARALGKASVRARAQQRAQAIPSSLRDRLRQMDPDVVKTACEEILAGNSAAAKVSVMRLLTDLEVYKADSREEWEKERNRQIQVAAEQFDQKITARVERARAIRRSELVDILTPVGLEDLASEDELAIVGELTRRLAAILEPVRSEQATAP
jgi:hypothetical protein